MMMPKEDAIHQTNSNTYRPYDVFLSFCGQDTRFTFTGNLYNALRHKRFKTFMDDNDENNQISPSIIKAIDESRISIVVFSENYASSSWCLDQLVRIAQCMKMNNQLVWPIYYVVNPSDIRLLRNNCAKAMAEHEHRFGKDSKKVQEWKSVLSDVTKLNGWQYDATMYEFELIRKIVQLAVQSLPRYDIFLSFTGEDTRYSFTGFLYNALRQEGFNTFMDDEGLVGGNQISQMLIQAIEKARLSIIVFSENYGYSTWCLDELAKIMECMETKSQLVWPIFYKVEQSDVSNQTNSYGDAMSAHEKRFGKDSDKVQTWRSALSQVANLKGWHFKTGYEYEFIQMIVEMAIDMENHPCVYVPSPQLKRQLEGRHEFPLHSSVEARSDHSNGWLYKRNGLWSK